MTTLWPIGGVTALVALVLLASRRVALRPLFRWLPVPLWCYFLPSLAVAAGWLPRPDPSYRLLTERLLPLALGGLLIGTDVPAVLRAGGRAWAAALAGAGSIILGAVIGVWALRDALPAEAWKGAGVLAGTWTGGTMNLLALRPILDVPDAIFAPLILVDALVAYTWMALLVAASGFEPAVNQWLRAERLSPSALAVSSGDAERAPAGAWLGCVLIVLALALISRAAARHLPTSPLISSSTGWTVLLVTTGSLLGALIRPLRRVGRIGPRLGTPLLYLVLGATGAQARLDAVISAPAWLLVGIIVAAGHGAVMLAVGRWLRLPLGVLATASQANIGGVVSAPLVGAVYGQALVPVGLLLALAGNAVGTYLGWLAALLSRWLLST